MIGKLNEKSGERYRSPFPIEHAELLRNFILSGPAGFWGLAKFLTCQRFRSQLQEFIHS